MRYGHLSFSICAAVIAAGALPTAASAAVDIRASSTAAIALTAPPQEISKHSEVAGRGDFNADGSPDVILGQHTVDRVTVVYGVSEAPPAGEGISVESPGEHGFTLHGVELLGEAVDAAGDVNDDGIDDLVVTAPTRDEAFVVYGTDSPDPADVDLGNIGARGFRVAVPQAVDVAAAGDVNADGVDDVIIGGYSENGDSWVVYGEDHHDPDDVDVSHLGPRGLHIAGAAEDDGASIVSAAGDVNGDGIDDVIVGAPHADANGPESGAAYVVFGDERPDPAGVDLASIGAQGMTLRGPDGGAYAGASVAAAGDFDDDGHDDVIVGAPGMERDRVQAGEAYVVYGGDNLPPSSMGLNRLGPHGIVIAGPEAEAAAGVRVAPGGDLDDDGVDDVIVATARGEGFVLMGGASVPGTIDLADRGLDGFVYSGTGRSTAVAAAGDWTGDGRDDFVAVTTDEEGKAFIVPGGSSGALPVDDDVSATEDGGPVSIHPLGNDVDADGGTEPEIDSVSSTAHGTTRVASKTEIEYEPAADYCGWDEFQYDVTGGLTATVHVEVACRPDAPVAVDDTFTTDEDHGREFFGLLSNDSDGDGDRLEIEFESTPGHGELEPNGPDGFVYIPDEDFNGEDTFTYVAKDGAHRSEPATVTVVVQPVNDAPRAEQDEYSLETDEVLEVDAPGLVGNDTDVDGDALRVRNVALPDHGDLSVNSDGSFTYNPDAGYTGADSFTYMPWDGSDEAEQPSTVTLNVDPDDGDPDKTPPPATPQDVQQPVQVPPVQQPPATAPQLLTALLGGSNAGTVTADRKGGLVVKKLVAQCGAGPCTFTATAAWQGRKVGTGKVVLKQGAKGAISLKLSTAARKLLRKKRSLTLTVNVAGTDAAGTRVTKTVRLKVKAAKRS